MDFTGECFKQREEEREWEGKREREERSSDCPGDFKALCLLSQAAAN